MIDNNKRKSVKGYELKILSAMLNDLSLIPEIADLFSEDNFSDNHRELFKKICELGKTQKDSTLLNASLPFEQDKNLLSTKNQNNGYIKLVNARELQTMELKPINWIIENLLPEGL